MDYQNIQSGLNTAFINKNISSNVMYRPQFISNDYKNGKKVLSTIEEELNHWVLVGVWGPKMFYHFVKR